MSDIGRRTTLVAKLLIASHTVRDLIAKIKEIEADTQTPSNEKLSEIKKIKEEITKVGTEIDSIKQEITLLSAYNIN